MFLLTIWVLIAFLLARVVAERLYQTEMTRIKEKGLSHAKSGLYYDAQWDIKFAQNDRTFQSWLLGIGFVLVWPLALVVLLIWMYGMPLVKWFYARVLTPIINGWDKLASYFEQKLPPGEL